MFLSVPLTPISNLQLFSTFIQEFRNFLSCPNLRWGREAASERSKTRFRVEQIQIDAVEVDLFTVKYFISVQYYDRDEILFDQFILEDKMSGDQQIWTLMRKPVDLDEKEAQ